MRLSSCFLASQFQNILASLVVSFGTNVKPFAMGLKTGCLLKLASVVTGMECLIGLGFASALYATSSVAWKKIHHCFLSMDKGQSGGWGGVLEHSWATWCHTTSHEVWMECGWRCVQQCSIFFVFGRVGCTLSNINVVNTMCNSSTLGGCVPSTWREAKGPPPSLKATLHH